MALLGMDQGVWLLSTSLLAAVLYSSVGHGDAAGYLAAIALFGLWARIHETCGVGHGRIVADERHG